MSGTPPAPQPSLLDRADLRALRDAAGRLDGPFATLAACLVAGGALEFDPDDPDWPDRDRVVAGDERATSALAAALGVTHPGAVTALAAWEALSHAVGLAAASRLDGGVFRTWCLLAGDAVEHGTTWEAARAAAAARLDTLVVVVAAPADRCAESVLAFRGAGWRDVSARGDDPAEVLGALDHALVSAPRSPAAGRGHRGPASPGPAVVAAVGG